MTAPAQVSGGIEPRVLTVAELTRQIRSLLEGCFAGLWVEGEVSNVTLARSGHLYFTLKDAEASLSCVMWRNATSRLRFRLEDGMKVQVFGGVGVYPPRGQYQFIAGEIRPRGVGELQLAFDQLRRKLEAEGLFDPARKRPLPRVPARVGVVTSPVGAAVRDIIQTARRRHPGVHLVVAPARVQGEGASTEIARAIRALDAFGQCDVILVARGGGSVEDLWAFNEEEVARAVAACRTPVVSGVGHEVDVTIVDYVADVRAPTPTAAAEIAIPVARDLLTQVGHLQARLSRAMRSRLDALDMAVSDLSHRLDRQAPTERLKRGTRDLDELRGRMERAMRHLLGGKEAHLLRSTASLDALSPLAVLQRGFAVVRRQADNRVVRDAAEVAAGDGLHVRLARGSLLCRVEEGRAG